MTQLDTTTETAALRSRRMLLAGFGAAALGGVAAIGTPAVAQAAGPTVPQESSGSKNVAHGGVATALATRKGKDGDLAGTSGLAVPALAAERPPIRAFAPAAGRQDDRTRMTRPLRRGTRVDGIRHFTAGDYF